MEIRWVTLNSVLLALKAISASRDDVGHELTLCL
jgi:hypothetical protein